MITTRPLADGFGIEVTGLDLATDVPEATLRELRQAFYRAGLMVLRGQELTAQRFAWFARQFGRPQPHILKHLRHPEVPEILPLSNIFKDGEPIGVYDGAAYWHTDMSYEAEPSSATIVHALQVPEEGGDTLFADQAGAYDALDAETKARIEGLTVLHHYGNRDDTVEASRTSASPLKGDEKKEVKDVFHPLVRPHPATGRKALYAVAGSSFGIVGMDDAEALPLLRRLARHATDTRFVHGWHYAVGDVVLWDNAQLLHSATLIEPATGPANTRYMHRISVKGYPDLADARAAE